MILISRDDIDSSEISEMLKRYDDIVVVVDKSVVDRLKWINRIKPVKFLVYSRDTSEERVLKELAENPPNDIYICVDNNKLVLYMDIIKVLRVKKYMC